MLVLKRKKKESIFIGGATVSVLHIGAENVTVGINAPPEIKIMRSEIVESDDDALTREDRKRSSYIARLRGMPEERRNRIIAQIVKEFCSPKSSLQTETPASCG